jgi:hypothetical protein
MSELDAAVVPWVWRARAFETDAHAILGLHESSPSRVVVLAETYNRLSALSVQQDDLFRQALRCAESGLFRAAHVMGWAAFMDFLEDKICEDGLFKLKAIRPKWTTNGKDELREVVNEYQLVDAARDLGLCTKTQGKALHGLLNKRNECAHPSPTFPGLNETLGYLSELLSRIDQIKPKSL